jgi:hypothetical protein
MKTSDVSAAGRDKASDEFALEISIHVVYPSFFIVARANRRNECIVCITAGITTLGPGSS